MRGLIIVYHRRDDLSIIGCVLRHLGEIEMADEGQPGIIARQLQGGIICTVALVVPDRQSLVDRDHFLVEIFMIPTNQDHGVLLQKGEDEALHLHGFLPAVEDIAQNDQLVRLRIGEIPRLIQRLMKFSIKAVNIGGDVVFHRIGFLLPRLAFETQLSWIPVFDDTVSQIRNARNNAFTNSIIAFRMSCLYQFG